MNRLNALPSLLTVGLLVVIAGCGSSPAPDPAARVNTPVASLGPAATPASNKTVHTHDGWWCDEHGVPEEVCGLCNSKLAAALQKSGKWCQDHDRPEGQCFKCHPELRQKFAAQYVAKYGKQPPTPEL